jgi:hypothetical protein
MVAVLISAVSYLNASLSTAPILPPAAGAVNPGLQPPGPLGKSGGSVKRLAACVASHSPLARPRGQVEHTDGQPPPILPPAAAPVNPGLQPPGRWGSRHFPVCSRSQSPHHRDESVSSLIKSG